MTSLFSLLLFCITFALAVKWCLDWIDYGDRATPTRPKAFDLGAFCTRIVHLCAAADERKAKPSPSVTPDNPNETPANRQKPSRLP